MTNISDDPIDWTRNAALPEVPAEASIQRTTSDRWWQINKIVFDGVPVEHEIKGIEEALLARKNLIESGGLQNSYDWKHDLECARYAHRFHLTNLEHVKSRRTKYLEFWQNWISESIGYFREVSLNGQKTIYLLHGAVAIGALNILVQKEQPSGQIILTAKLAIIFSSLGILLAGIGQVISFYFGSEFVTRIRAKLASPIKWAKIRAFPRYIKRYGWLSEFGDKAIYASIFWFGVYVGILLITLISA